MTSYFVTGTDTDAGKTHVARALLIAARERGLSVAGYKPIESGCPSASTPGPDATAIALAAGTLPLTSYTLTAPISPHLAAEQGGVTIQVDTICARTRELAERYEFLIVEGAGGFLVPISKNETIAELAKALAVPILIVAANRLGAINHALLTIEAARYRGISVAGLVLTDLQNGAGRGLENSEAIRKYGAVSVFTMPHTESEQELARAGAHLLDALLADAES